MSATDGLVVFLDIDGVLVTELYRDRDHGQQVIKEPKYGIAQ